MTEKDTREMGLYEVKPKKLCSSLCT